MRQTALVATMGILVLFSTVTTNWGSDGRGLSHHIFVTSATYRGNLGGPVGADSLCAAHAESGSLTSHLNVTWRALISTHGVIDARDRVRWAGPVYDMNGDLATNDPSTWPWVGDGVSDIGIDENGDPPPDAYVWTGSDVTGVSVGPGNDCNGWTNGTSSSDGWAGESGTFANPTWIDSFGDACDDDWYSLYCVSEAEDFIFADGFEFGSTGAWSGTVP